MKKFAAVVFVAALGAAALHLGLRAQEATDCLQWQSWRDQGYPIQIPNWCYEEGFLERQ